MEGVSIDALLDDFGEFRVLQLLPSAPGKPARRRRRLPPGSSLRRSAKVGFTADALLKRFHVRVVSGSLMLPDPYRCPALRQPHAAWL